MTPTSHRHSLKAIMLQQDQLVRLKEKARPFLNVTIRKNLHNLMIASRKRTVHLRAIPDFVIVGSHKCGTTSLFHYLVQHPQIVPSISKEIHYYSVHYARGDAWYRAHYPLKRDLEKLNALTGEATPYYIFHPLAMQRIWQANPSVKLIWLVRNPVHRTISHYFDNQRSGLEKVSLQRALELEESRLVGEVEKIKNDVTYNSIPHKDLAYKRCSTYINQAENNLSMFAREQILIRTSEAFFARPAEVLTDVYNFLGVKSTTLPNDLRARNVGSYSNVSTDILEQLEHHFSPLNARFEAFVGQKLGW